MLKRSQGLQLKDLEKLFDEAGEQPERTFRVVPWTEDKTMWSTLCFQNAHLSFVCLVS